MSKNQKKKHNTCFNEILNDIKTEKSIQESISTSEEDIKQQIISNKNNNEQYLALSFKYLTENKDYNFQAFKKDKSRFEAFITRLNNTLKLITQFKIKNLYNDPFKDKFEFSNLYPNVYKNSNKHFQGTEQVISIELSSKSNERIILYHEDNEVDGRNILYVLGFDFNHNMYKH